MDSWAKNLCSQFTYENVGPNKIEMTKTSSRIYIASNGAVLTNAGGGCVFLVKRGGRLAEDMGGGSTLIYETDAFVPPAPRRQDSSTTRMEVGASNFSHGPIHLDIAHHR